MEKAKTLIIAAAVLLICVSAGLAEQQITTKGKISNVTVYRGQALVTRTINTELPEGNTQLTVRGLPGKIIPESLFAQSSEDTKVLSVRYRERAVRNDIREEVKELDEQIENLETEIYQTERKKHHLNHQWSMFVKLRDFTISAADSDLNRGLLTFKPIRDLTNLIQQEGQSYIEKTLAFEQQLKELKKELELLNRKRSQLDSDRIHTEREAVLYIKNLKSKKQAGIELNYLVKAANWTPQYNLRADKDNSQILLEYNAVVNQTSGEDWTKANIKLSTAEPAMVAAPPTLDPLEVKLSRENQATQQQRMPGFQKASAGQPFTELIKSRKEQAKKGAQAEDKLRKLATTNQLYEFNIQQSALDKVKEQVRKTRRIEGISVTYELPGKLSLPSRKDRELVNIESVRLDGDFTLISTPLLTDYVYLQAQVHNSSETIFLPGPADMFRNGEFVGKSSIPIVTSGEHFTAGFGIDSQVQVTRELKNKDSKIKGGNRVDTYDYRISIDNYKNSKVNLRLVDRLPYAEYRNIEIELLEAKPDLSKDIEKGILQWDLELPANSTGDNATIATYKFTIEYDKNMTIQPSK